MISARADVTILLGLFAADGPESRSPSSDFSACSTLCVCLSDLTRCSARNSNFLIFFFVKDLPLVLGSLKMQSGLLQSKQNENPIPVQTAGPDPILLQATQGTNDLGNNAWQPAAFSSQFSKYNKMISSRRPGVGHKCLTPVILVSRLSAFFIYFLTTFSQAFDVAGALKGKKKKKSC